MHEIIKNVIAAGGYKLAEIQHKVKKLYILGDLTEEQLDELLVLAQRNASAENERPETISMLRKLADRVAVLEQRLDAQDGSGEPTSEYEAWTPWDGISTNYQQGAVVSHNGKLWQSAHPGQNTWEPGTVGTDNLWVEYSLTTEEK